MVLKISAQVANIASRNNLKQQKVPKTKTRMPETKYSDRTDSFEEKLRLMEAAWRKKDFRLARSLAHSLRHSAMQAQAEEESPGQPLGPAKLELVESLPAPWT